jgi:serine/threonine protein phosphatase PrpC
MEKTSLVFDLSLIGKSHLDTRIPKQDYSLSFKSEDYSILVVCDGHSTSIRSDIGSKFAAETTKDVFSSLFENLKDKNMINPKFKLDQQVVEQIKLRIHSSWIEKVKNHFESNELSENERLAIDKKHSLTMDTNPEKIYGTTLLAVLITEFYNVYLQIGDGFIINTYPEMKQEILFRSVDDRPPGVTESLSMDNPYESIRVVQMMNKKIDAVMILTDGIYNMYEDIKYFFASFPSKFISYLLTSEIDDMAISDLKEYTEKLVNSETNSIKDDASFAYYLSNKVDPKDYNLLEYEAAFDFIKETQNSTSNLEFDVKLFNDFNYIQHQHLFNFFNNKKIVLDDFASSKVNVKDLELLFKTLSQKVKLTPIQQIKIFYDYVLLMQEKKVI